MCDVFYFYLAEEVPIMQRISPKGLSRCRALGWPEYDTIQVPLSGSLFRPATQRY